MSVFPPLTCTLVLEVLRLGLPCSGLGTAPSVCKLSFLGLGTFPWQVRENRSGIHSTTIPAELRRSLLRDLLLTVLELSRESENNPNHLKNRAGDTSTKCCHSQLLRD